MTARDFAYAEYRDYIIYGELARVEPNHEFKKILTELVEHEWGDYTFWRGLSDQKKFHVSPLEIFLLKKARVFLGLTFIVKVLESGERKAVRNYNQFLKTAPRELHDKIKGIIAHETYHETRLIQQIREEKVEFIGSIVLGINDGLIELTGALVGFSFAFINSHFVALSGLITGIAASLSMSASAYMQARHETNGRDPAKAALYTGISYGAVVVLLVAPYFIVPQRMLALAIMFCIVFFVIGGVSYYTAIIFNRSFQKQAGTMLVFSLGIAFVSFVIGSALQRISGIMQK